MKKLMSVIVLALPMLVMSVPAQAIYIPTMSYRPVTIMRPAYVTPTPRPTYTAPKATPTLKQSVSRPIATANSKKTTTSTTPSSVITSWWNGWTGFLAGWSLFNWFDSEDKEDGRKD